ncbi:hypothetical protein F0562_006064 [Nyssa sinensis]|uniref:Pentacotripeptide-repeat region of PRORP domain-containing protein n=1 Tax=Nyssa sinensis TaxID=561372 RepID=A0A5J5AJV9_9ASTE|nr:hypothetical protein F0562_006064 [Nyssa sinensis]
MSKRGLKVALSLRSNRFFLPKIPLTATPSHSHSFKFSRQIFFSFITRFLTTSSPDNLDGLIDPDLNFPGNESFSLENSHVQSVSADEFAFLQDSLLEPGDDCSSSKEKIDSGKCSNDAFLIWNAILNNNDNFGDKTQKFLRQFREKLNESLVVDLLNLIQNAELGVKFFIWAGRQIGYSHTVPVYNALLDVLGCNKDDRVSEHILKEIKDDDKEVLGRLLNLLIRKYCRNGMWNTALEELGRLKDFGYKPSKVTFNALIQDFALWVFEQKKAGSGDYSYAYKLLKKMVNCGCQPGYVVYNILIGGICGNEELPSSNVLELAEQAYSEMLDAGVVLNKINVCNFARCLCGAGKFEKAYNVIHEMMSKGFIPDSSTYSKVIGFLCNASKVEKAFLLFEEMKRNGNVPDVYTYTILIDSFCKAGLIQQARRWFDEMIKVGCAPNVVTYTALIHAYLKARKLSNANELFEMMLSEGCAPNVVTYTALIDGYCKAGDIEKACQIYARMRGSGNIPDVDMYFKVDDSKTREPNVVTYGALVDGLCKAHKVKEARDLLDAMSVEGCEPNHIVYGALIDGFCKVGKLDEAQEVFVKMSERGYNPNVYTFSSLIDRLFKDKRLDLALKVLSKMLENSCPPNVIIYTGMIDGLCKVGKTDEAYKLMLMMEEKGCHPNVVTYTAMIDGFWKAGKVDKCLELFRQMGARGCAPNYVTYRVLINHCCAAGLLDEAHQLLEEMKQTYWPRHMASYRKVIEGFNREFMVNLGLLEEISENDSAPIVPVYRILIESFCKAGRLEAALELLREISSSSHFLSDDRIMYSSLIESLSLSCGRKHLNLHMAYVTWISIGYLMQIHVKETESCNLMDGSNSGGLLFMSSNTEIKKITSVGILDLKKRVLFFVYHYIDLMEVGDAARAELIQLVLVNLVVADYFNLGSGYLLVILISLNIKCCCYSILFLPFSL